MTFSNIPGHAHSRRGPSCLAFVTAAVLAACAAGCASPKPPRPPSLNLPEIAKDLTAQRTGNQVWLRWTTPEKTTDRLEIKGTVTAAICRIQYGTPPPATQTAGGPATPAKPPCVPVTRLNVRPGASQATDSLPGPVLTDPATLLGYRIQLSNANGRSAGLSTPAFAAAGAAPATVQDLRATNSPNGAVLAWKRENTTASVELDRVLAASSAVPSGHPKPTHPATRPSSGAKSAPSARAKPPGAAPPNPGEVRLTTPAETADAGGVIDSTTAKGDTYRYTAQRVRTVSLNGHSLTIRSLPSLPVTVVMRDIFPPAVPTGLEAVPGGTSPADRSIDLSWTPDTNPDLAGYFIYRQDVLSTGAVNGSPIRLNKAPIAGPGWRDSTVVSGRRYAYRVTAVDASGNESAPSTGVQEFLREP